MIKLYLRNDDMKDFRVTLNPTLNYEANVALLSISDVNISIPRGPY